MSFLVSNARRLFSYGHFNNPDDLELGESYGNQRRNKRMKILAVTIVCGIIAIVVISMSVKHKNKIQDALSNLPKDFSSATNQNYRDGKFIGLDNDYKSIEMIMASTHYNHLGVHEQYLSADGKYLMLKVNANRIFRRSSRSEFDIFPLTDHGTIAGHMSKLRPSTTHGSQEPFYIRNAKFAPTGSAIVYVDDDGNIFYRRNAEAEDEKVTENGKFNQVFNGIADWVFEEEVLESSDALWWGPDGQSFVWGMFNDTGIEVMPIPFYGTWDDVAVYPDIQDVGYPKVGTPNPVSQIWLAKIDDGKVSKRQVMPPKSLKDAEVHFSWVEYVNEKYFVVQWMNRVQSKTVASMCNVDDASDCKEIFAEEEDQGWIDYKYRLTFDPKWDESQTDVPDFVTILADPTGKYRYRQVLLVTGDERRIFLSDHEADVTEILKWTTDGYVYYVGSMDNQPRSRHLFRVKVSLHGHDKPVCMTCNRTDMAELHRRPCTYHDITMSTNGSYFAMVCSGPDIPYVCIHNTTNDQLVEIYENNERITNLFSDMNLPTTKLIEVPVSGTDQKAQVKIYFPPDFNPSKKYPALVHIYGGPGNQLVDDKFDQHDYQTYLSGSKGFIYIIIDPMGSAQQGNEWLFSMFHNFGGPEARSTIEVTKYLQKTMDFIDKERTAIWGWSYGGFLTLSVLGQDTEKIFSCGASVAPVVDWSLYDTYYTERYMGTLEENKEGYNKSRVFWNLENIRGRQLLLMHGTMDDNVHYQQSLLLAGALEEKDILFRQVSYLNQDHSIWTYLKHLYHTLTDYLLNDCFEERKERK